MRRTMLLLVVGLLLIVGIAFAADALTYKITDVKVDGQTVTVTVDYAYGDYKETVSVPVFQPATKEMINEAVKNRALTIKVQVDATKVNESVAPTVEKGKVVTVE